MLPSNQRIVSLPFPFAPPLPRDVSQPNKRTPLRLRFVHGEFPVYTGAATRLSSIPRGEPWNETICEQATTRSFPMYLDD